MSCSTSSRATSSTARLRTLFPKGRIAYTGIGVVPRALEGRVFLAAVYHGSPAERAGLLVGDEIVSADGEPFDPIDSFDNKAGVPVSLEIRRVEARPTFPVEVVPRRIEPNEFFLSAMRASVRVVEREGRRWGYVRVWSYARRQYHHLLIEELAEGRLKDVDGLVLDLRGGWGGAQPEYTELFVGGAPIMTYVGRDGRENYASFRWRRPVVVLVDEGTRSGKEVVTYGLLRTRVIQASPSSSLVFVGIDVAKDHLDLHLRPSARRSAWRATHALQELAARLVDLVPSSSSSRPPAVSRSRSRRRWPASTCGWQS